MKSNICFNLIILIKELRFADMCELMKYLK